MPTYVRYRISSGEVENVLVAPSQPTAETYYNYAPAVDGYDTAPPKIFAGGTVREATAPEIAGFAATRAADANLEARAAALALVQAVQAQATIKALRGVIALLVDEINENRLWKTNLKAAFAAQSTYGGLRTAVANNTTFPNLPPRTMAQAKTAIENKLSSGVAD